MQEKIFHFWFNTFFIKELRPEEDNGSLPVERTTRALSCDGAVMDFPAVHAKPRTGSLASLEPLSPLLCLSLDKTDLDGAHKDKNHKLFSPNFKVFFYFLISIDKVLICYLF